MGEKRKESGWPIIATLAVVIVPLAYLMGCSSRVETASPTTSTQSLTVEEKRIVEIARQAVATNDTWVDRAEFDRPVKNPDGDWSITVWYRPATPGGHRTITINEDGKVTDYQRGK